MTINKHLFAIHVEFELPQAVNSSQKYCFKNKNLADRLLKILRLRHGESVILFDRSHHGIFTLSLDKSSSNTEVAGTFEEIFINKPLTPDITILQAIPKKSVFEEIIYNAAQLGASTIIPIKTQKSSSWLPSIQEQERFKKILTAACEQAKQFVIPKILPEKNLADIALDKISLKILFDASGDAIKNHTQQLSAHEKIFTFFGSEGGLSPDEIELLTKEKGFISLKLCSTILRSEDAPLLGIGFLRSLNF